MNETKKFVGGGVQKYSSHKQNLLQEAKAPALFNSEPFAILLQLHAQVANPYTFKITKNVTVKATISSAVPAKETQLGNGPYVADTTNIQQGGHVTFSITIPSGVTVLKIVHENTIGQGQGSSVLGRLISKSSPSLAVTWSSQGGTGSHTSYIGVSSGKTYLLGFSANSTGNVCQGRVNIYYSSSINQETPNVTDYI